MIDQEFNESVDKQIALLQLSNILSVASVDEKLGKWDELLESRETSIKLFQNLFSIAPDELTTENQEKISNLRLTEYPRELCSLSKCYIVKERYDDAIDLLQESIDLGSEGAKMLAGVAYLSRQKAEADFHNAARLLTSIDILSDAVNREVNNEYFQANALFGLSLFYRLFQHDNAKAYNCLSQIINTDWQDDLKVDAVDEIAHYKKGFFGGYKYIE